MRITLFDINVYTQHTLYTNEENKPEKKKMKDREGEIEHGKLGEKRVCLDFEFFLFFFCSYKDSHKAPRLRSYQYVNGEKGRYIINNMGIFFFHRYDMSSGS